MTYPQQQYPQPQMPGYPQPAGQPQFPQGPPQQSYAPAPAYPAPTQQYGPPAGYHQQYGPPQGYPQQPPAPAPQPAAASLDDFYAQPSIGWGPSITPNSATPDGTATLLVVAQHITRSHIEHATKYQSTELDYYRDGRPKLVMKVPAFVAPGTTYTTANGAVQPVTDGRAQLYVQGGDKDMLAAAMAAAGVTAGAPELGALIRVTKVSNRRNQSGTNSAVRTYEYWRPGPEVATIAQQAGIQYPDLNTPKPADSPGQAAPAAPASAPPVQQPAAPMAPVPLAVDVHPPAPAPMPPAPVAAPAGLNPEQQALLAQLTGQTTG